MRTRSAWLAAAAALAALAVSAGGCGGDGGSHPGPLVGVSWIRDSGGAGGVAMATLTPKDSPTCTVAFKVVRGGKATTLGSYRAQPLADLGGLSVQNSARSVDVSWLLPGTGAGQQQMHVDVPRGVRYVSMSWSGGSVGGPYPEDGGEQTIWAEERYAGAPPAAGGLLMGSFQALVDDTLRRPRLVVYCVTLAVKTK